MGGCFVGLRVGGRGGLELRLGYRRLWMLRWKVTVVVAVVLAVAVAW